MGLQQAECTAHLVLDPDSVQCILVATPLFRKSLYETRHSAHFH